MIRTDDKDYIFSRSDYKYLNLNDIEDMYMLCVQKKLDQFQCRILNTLVVYNRSGVILSKVHVFQQGVESYQHRVNLTAPTHTFKGIEKM